jgi:alpha-tubulin suppressor-like RCC1 family protein
MTRILAVLTTSSLLLSGACADRPDPTEPIPTTPDRPARLSYAYARIEGSIVIKEKGHHGFVLVTCGDNAIAGVANQGSYSMVLRLEVTPGLAAAACYIDVGQPVQTTRAFEVPLVTSVVELKTQEVDVLVLPDAPAAARMELPIRSVSAAGAHTCAVSATNAAYCWGLNKAAELGFGWHLRTSNPARVVWDNPAVQVLASGSNTWYYGGYMDANAPRSCALKQDGAVYCWGDASVEAPVAFADSFLSSQEPRLPQRVEGVPPLTRIFGGGKRPCGITISNDLYCWGNVIFYDDVAAGLVDQGVVDVASSKEHRCWLKTTGKWRCSGDREWGEFGDTTTTHTFKRIAAGHNFTCALDADGLAYCWGRNNSGQLGRGSTTAECDDGGIVRLCPGTSVVPQRVATDVRFTQIEAGEHHVCALAVEGHIYCWGEGKEGQLGNRGNIDQSIPVVVGLIEQLRFTQFSVGEHHACGVATDGKLYCWGQGDYGQLGTGTNADQNRPVAVWGQ